MSAGLTICRSLLRNDRNPFCEKASARMPPLVDVVDGMKAERDALFEADNAPAAPDAAGHRLRHALPAGSRLKTFNLARRYGVSVNPVREALHQLSGEGFVVLSRNRGARVRTLDEHFVRNIFDIRAMIEVYLIRLFVEHACEADLRRLKDIQRRIDEIGELLVELDRLDQKFHGITYDRHFNEEALSIRERHGQVVQALALQYPASPARRRAQNAEHWRVIEAVEHHHEAEAIRVVEQHARGAEKHLLERLRQSHLGQD